MFEESVKLDIGDVMNIEAAYRWMDKYVMSVPLAPPGREEFLDAIHKTLDKVRLVESIIHFENNTSKVKKK